MVTFFIPTKHTIISTYVKLPFIFLNFSFFSLEVAPHWRLRDHLMLFLFQDCYLIALLWYLVTNRYIVLVHFDIFLHWHFELSLFHLLHLLYHYSFRQQMLTKYRFVEICSYIARLFES